MTKDELIFERSKAGKKGISFPKERIFSKPLAARIPDLYQRKQTTALPEISEPEIVRHFVNLSRKNFSIDTHFYPLGSCTMKYNPKINEEIARLDGFAWIHPFQTPETIQGALQVLFELQEMLCEITGMDAFSLQPAAGAHGELCGMMLVRAYYHQRQDFKRTKVIVPDSSHGTNPASAALCGFEVVTTPSGPDGRVDLIALEKAMDDHTACLMLTNPNTLGLFEKDILQITRLAHQKGILLYYDGANLNPLLGIVRPGDMGFDIVHLNLHKTFSTPHGGGGPGAGPVGVKKSLIPFLPVPAIKKKNSVFELDSNQPHSIGKVRSFFGNFGVLLRAYVYIRTIGSDGLTQISRDAILNANYLRRRLEKLLEIPYNDYCMHEFVATVRQYKSKGLHASDFGKRMLDFGIHAPTVHFPLVVEDALMIEPTETESKEVLDQLVEVFEIMVKEANDDPESLKKAPYTMPIRRPDEVQAARKPILSWRDYSQDLKRPSSPDMPSTG
ncbi:MAG: glycine dehydrogenase (aminomethyl-transferring) [Candidatus Omnitrophica bacterium CG11_big_fil_rev_8_21_14_0_20_45_26]|uniref:Probable glycine dehydrogenase (decarboxylating) subunit 2 n=1 Tax=Candidatus Abzuiibacterium crystallinum TaxID=1974748 RepID=A0A2H0LRM6_9BACT|nr:MAG: glycine dehydrogenase (aminomethyl-transferring) [Candidatus Omnitrophica bacterium CG11_big_fil_rev_8_21_14_0_20_45_26]PIW64355.1 MAG: glycine dehydrogenase (aminomethyl-transferring) [Candidatus Omnitrophica bacterium CG12_big_fil_rev_8_21_14_0_65_45_16]